MSASENSLDLFLNGFAARDLAEALPSFDDTIALAQLRAAIEPSEWEVIGVRRSGRIAGWLSRDDVANGVEPSRCRSFEPATLIEETTSLNEVVHGLRAAPCLFVRSFGEVSGVVRRRDVEKPPMRMWLFGLVTITELRVTRMIAECCPDGAWRQFLSEGRLRMAATLQEERRRRGQQPSLLDCLQFADKGRIVARHEMLRERSRFASRRAVEDFVKELQDLRNNLAHAQDIAGDWDVIADLAMNLHRVVLGPGVVASLPTIEPDSATSTPRDSP